MREDGTWLIGYFTTYDGVSYIKSIARNQRFGCGIDVIPESVGQFTGLCDDNGVEMYEGDIIERLSGRTVIEWNDDICEMQYSDGTRLNADDNYGCWRVVLGNIHQNPELRETKQDSEIGITNVKKRNMQNAAPATSSSYQLPKNLLRMKPKWTPE